MNLTRLQLVILIGNIGSGKTTLCKRYSERGYLIVSRDSLRSMLGGPNGYIFNADTEKAIHRASTTLISYLLKDRRSNIVIDETNMNKATRKRYIELAKFYSYEIVAHETYSFTKEECIANRQKDNLRGYTPELWGEIWEKFNRTYQEPAFEEGFDMLIKEDTKE